MLLFMTVLHFNSNVHISKGDWLSYVPLKPGIFLFIESCPLLRIQTHVTAKPCTFSAQGQPAPDRIAPRPSGANQQRPGNFQGLCLARVPLPHTPPPWMR